MAGFFNLTAGDTYPAIEEVLSNSDGAIDLTGATVVFILTPEGYETPVIEDPAEVVLPQTGSNLGRVKYDWQSGDTDVAGDYEAKWRVTFSGGQTATFPRGPNTSPTTVVVR